MVINLLADFITDDNKLKQLSNDPQFAGSDKLHFIKNCYSRKLDLDDNADM